MIKRLLWSETYLIKPYSEVICQKRVKIIQYAKTLIQNKIKCAKFALKNRYKQSRGTKRGNRLNIFLYRYLGRSETIITWNEMSKNNYRRLNVILIIYPYLYKQINVFLFFHMVVHRYVTKTQTQFLPVYMSAWTMFKRPNRFLQDWLAHSWLFLEQFRLKQSINHENEHTCRVDQSNWYLESLTSCFSRVSIFS